MIRGLMLKDRSYFSDFKLAEKSHRYGNFFHLLDDPMHMGLLSRFCQNSTVQPEANRLMSTLYRFLCNQAINQIFLRQPQVLKTRMQEHTPLAEMEAEGFDPQLRAVVVDIMRAGILPSQICFESLHDALPPEQIRQDHILMNRETNEKGEVIGVRISGHKIGGSIADSYVFIPDPMGATGGSLCNVIELLKKRESKSPRLFVGLHLIVTPEFLRAAKKYESELKIFALRLDRGLSSEAVLKTLPGERWNEERGLNDHQYIVPGAGGIGEILNNSFV